MFSMVLFLVALVLLTARVITTLREDQREPDHDVPMKTMRDHWLLDRWGGGSG